MDSPRDPDADAADVAHAAELAAEVASDAVADAVADADAVAADAVAADAVAADAVAADAAGLVGDLTADLMGEWSADAELTAELTAAVAGLAARFGDEPVGLARLAVLAAALAVQSFDVSMSPPLLNEVVASLSQASRSLDVVMDVVVDRWDTTHAWGYDGALSGSAWMSNRFNDSRGWTRRQIADAHRLTAMPATFAALRDGTISRSVALKLAEARDVLPEAFDAAEASLLEVVVGRHAREAIQQIRVWIAHAQAMKDSNAPDPTPAPPVEASTLSFLELLDGRLRLQGELDAHDAQLVKTAIENLASKDCDYNRPHGERLADGLVTLAQLGLDSGQAGSAQQPHVVVGVSLDDFERRTNTSARYADGSPVSEQALSLMLCNSNLHVLLQGLNREPLAMGRARRLATLAQRLALGAKWGGCAFPGCDQPSGRTQAHHETCEWDDGGNTDIDNLIPLCHAHHRLRHRIGWSITQQPDGTVTATHPDGHTITDHRRQHTNPPPHAHDRPTPDNATTRPSTPPATQPATPRPCGRISETSQPKADGTVAVWRTIRFERDALLDDEQRNAILEQLEALWR